MKAFLLSCLTSPQRREEIDSIIEELFKQELNPEHYLFSSVSVGWDKTTHSSLPKEIVLGLASKCCHRS